MEAGGTEEAGDVVLQEAEVVAGPSTEGGCGEGTLFASGVAFRAAGATILSIFAGAR